MHSSQQGGASGGVPRIPAILSLTATSPTGKPKKARKPKSASDGSQSRSARSSDSIRSGDSYRSDHSSVQVGGSYGAMAGLDPPQSPLLKSQTSSGAIYGPSAGGGTAFQRFARSICCCRLTRGTALFRFSLLLLSALVVLSG